MLRKCSYVLTIVLSVVGGMAATKLRIPAPILLGPLLVTAVLTLTGAMGRAGARRYEPGRETVTFADVAGIDEAKQELTEIVDFLRDPAKYRRLGRMDIVEWYHSEPIPPREDLARRFAAITQTLDTHGPW